MVLGGIPEVLKLAAEGLRRVPIFLFVMAVCCTLAGVVVGYSGQDSWLVIVLIVAAVILTLAAIGGWLFAVRGKNQKISQDISQDISADRRGDVSADDAQVVEDRGEGSITQKIHADEGGKVRAKGAQSVRRKS